MFFAASDQNSQQMNLLFEAFNVHGFILHKLDHRRKNWALQTVRACKRFHVLKKIRRWG